MAFVSDSDFEPLDKSSSVTSYTISAEGVEASVFRHMIAEASVSISRSLCCVWVASLLTRHTDIKAPL